MSRNFENIRFFQLNMQRIQSYPVVLDFLWWHYFDITNYDSKKMIITGLNLDEIKLLNTYVVCNIFAE